MPIINADMHRAGTMTAQSCVGEYAGPHDHFGLGPALIESL